MLHLKIQETRENGTINLDHQMTKKSSNAVSPTIPLVLHCGGLTFEFFSLQSSFEDTYCTADS